MDVTCLIVGIDGWREWTWPLLQSIKKHEPSVGIRIVDNASLTPYPDIEEVIRLDERVCYAAAINRGMEDSDWTLVLNNDVLCEGPFLEHLEWMQPNTLYGNQLIVHNQYRWLGLWLFAISKAVWSAVGPFDENFEVCGFDDCDYCLRAHQLGIRIEKSNLPFKHFWGKTRWDVPNYQQIRLNNKHYLEEKHGISIGEQDDWRVFN